jgi:zinc transport system substrate-binding protein
VLSLRVKGAIDQRSSKMTLNVYTTVPVLGCILLCQLLLMASPKALAEQAEYHLSASIRPWFLLANEIAPDAVQVEQVLPAGTSPHSYQLSVSDRKRLADADLVVWTGPELESFLESMVARKTTIQVDKLPGLKWPGEAHTHHHHGHDHGALDPHTWLSPFNAQIAAKAIAAKLVSSNLPREAKAQIMANVKQFEERLELASTEWKAQLAPHKDTSWLLYHDMLRHFQDHFDLGDFQIITDRPEVSPGAKHLHELRSAVSPGQCLLVEDYYPTRHADKLEQELALHRVGIDPLGFSADSYIDLMDRLVTAVADCLAGKPAQ